MSNLIELHQKARIREEASIWVVRLKEGLSDKQEHNFAEWLNRHKNHRDALVEIATAWDELDIIEQLSSTLPAIPVQYRTEPVNWKSLGLAATLLICIFIAWSGYKEPAQKLDPVIRTTSVETAPTYDTAVGEQSKVTLPDGSNSSLNTNSKIVVIFSKTERKVELLQGEVMFEVKPDKTRPFVVLVGDVTVRAVGTVFNVRRKGNNALEVLVSEGKVAIFSPTGRNSQGVRKTHHKVELSAGEMVDIQNSSENVTKIDQKKMKDRLAWTTGMVVFDDQPLEQVITELSRYTKTRIILGDPNLASINVAGYFKVGDVDALLIALSENFDITWKEQDNNVIVLQSR